MPKARRRGPVNTITTVVDSNRYHMTRADTSLPPGSPPHGRFLPLPPRFSSTYFHSLKSPEGVWHIRVRSAVPRYARTRGRVGTRGPHPNQTRAERTATGLWIQTPFGFILFSVFERYAQALRQEIHVDLRPKLDCLSVSIRAYTAVSHPKLHDRH